MLKILSDKGITADRMQVQQLEQHLGEANIDPFQLRGNYGQQYKVLIGLGEQKLVSILLPPQLRNLNSLGRSEYRISLSRQQTK